MFDFFENERGFPVIYCLTVEVRRMKQEGKYGRVICARSSQRLSVDKEFLTIKEAKGLKMNVPNSTMALLVNNIKNEKKKARKTKNARNPLDKALSRLWS